MKHYKLVKINAFDKVNLILKLNKINVDIKNIRYEKDYLTFEILDEDIKRVEKYLPSVKIEIIDETGIYKIKNIIKKSRMFITSLIFGAILFLILNNLIIRVNVIHSDKNIRQLLQTSLEERGVKPFTLRKSYEEYERIIADIKNTYKDQIEWLEIDVTGMSIDIRVEERIIKEYTTDTNTCHIIAAKSGIITNILTLKGTTLVPINSYVNKGDILISGEVKLNDEVKSNVCAKGDVYAEVWYTANGVLPLKYIDEEKTGKMRYNFMVKKNSQEYVILNSRIKNAKIVEKKLLFKLFNYEFYIEKEYEVNKKELYYTDKEAEKKLKDAIYEKLNFKDEFSEIIYEKVLKKSSNNGNLVMEMFIAKKEQIGVQDIYNVESSRDTNDGEYNKDYS